MAAEGSPAGLGDFGEEVRSAIRRAELASIRLHHNYVGSEHLLIGLAEAPSLRPAFDGLLSPAGARDAVEQILGRPKRPAASPPGLTPSARATLQRAHQIAQDLGGPPVTARHLVLALVELDDDAMASRVLRLAGIARPDLLARLREDP